MLLLAFPSLPHFEPCKIQVISFCLSSALIIQFLENKGVEGECKSVVNNGWDCQYEKETVYCALLVLQVSQQELLHRHIYMQN